MVADSTRNGVPAAGKIPNLLPHHHVVISAPLTNDTHGLVDKSFLAAMPHGALVVNAGHGKIVDPDVSVAKLQSEPCAARLT